MVFDALGGCEAGAKNSEKLAGTPDERANVPSTSSKEPVTTGNLCSLTANDLAEMTGKHAATVRRALQKLAELDLVTNHGGRPALWSLGQRSLSDVAEALECKQHADRRQIRHEIQREAWHNLLARNKAGALPKDLPKERGET
jgi:DNA-binding transcriptional regulator YhcF (GntR family)